MSASLEQELLSALKARGMRITRTRRAIINALVSDPSHLTPEHIQKRLSKKKQRVHFTTVYRTLNALSDMGLLQHVHVGHGAGSYHLAHIPHHHLTCAKCGKIVEMPMAALPPSFKEKLRKEGFDPEVDMTLSGVCLECSRLSEELRQAR